MSAPFPPEPSPTASTPAQWRMALMLLLATVPWIHPINPGPSVSAGALLVSWACIGGLLLTGAGRSAYRRLPMWGWAGASLGLAGLALLSLKIGAGPEGVGLIGVVALVCACIFRFAGADEAEITVLMQATLLAGVLSTLMGLVQVAGWADALAPWVSHNNPGEAYGNLRQRNLYASHLNIALCALLWLSTRETRPMPVGLVAALAALLTLGNVFSHSRTGLFELLLMAALSCWWRQHRHHPGVRVALIAAGLTYVVTSIALPWLTPAGADQGILSRLTDTSGPCMSRVALWRNVLELIAQRPWLGWGWGELDYAHMMHAYPSERFCAILDNAHNLPLHLAVELGIPCAALICLAIGGSVVRLRPWAETHPARQLAWLMLAVVGLHSLLEYPLWYGPFQLAVGISLGLLWAAPHNTVASTSPANPSYRYPAMLNAILGLTLLGGVAYASWDYHLMRQIYLSPEDRSPAYRDDPMSALHQSHLFRDHARFAELTMMTLGPDNAEWAYATSTQLLHFSPEPRVLEKAIESAALLGHDQESLLYLSRLIAVYPQDHSQWQQRQLTQASRPASP